MAAAVGGVAVVLTVVMAVVMMAVLPALAMHEADHRFAVEGYVCGPDGQPVEDLKVVVKDTRVSLAKTAYTDSDGYYRTVLHFHNDNLGDPLVIFAGEREQKAKVEFDPEDTESERSIKVNFGEGCEALAGDIEPWVLYSAGATGVALAAYCGARAIRKRGRAARGKGKKKRKER